MLAAGVWRVRKLKSWCLERGDLPPKGGKIMEIMTRKMSEAHIFDAAVVKAVFG